MEGFDGLIRQNMDNLFMHNVIRASRYWKLPDPLFPERWWRGGEGTPLSHAVEPVNADNNYDAFFPLHFAARNGQMKKLRAEIAANPDNVDSTCYLGATALHYACSANEPDAVRVLLDAGADPYLYWSVPRVLLPLANVHESASRECAAMGVALANSSTACVKVLLDDAAHRDEVYFMRKVFETRKAALPALAAMRSHLPCDIVRIVWSFLAPVAEMQHEKWSLLTDRASNAFVFPARGFARQVAPHRIVREHGNDDLDGIDKLLKPHLKALMKKRRRFIVS